MLIVGEFSDSLQIGVYLDGLDWIASVLTVIKHDEFHDRCVEIVNDPNNYDDDHYSNDSYASFDDFGSYEDYDQGCWNCGSAFHYQRG